MIRNEAVVVIICFNISPLFLKEVLELLVCCAASTSSSLPTFRDSVAVPYIKGQHVQMRFSILLGSVDPSKWKIFWKINCRSMHLTEMKKRGRKQLSFRPCKYASWRIGRHENFCQGTWYYSIGSSGLSVKKSRSLRQFHRFPKCGAIMRVLWSLPRCSSGTFPLGYDAASVGDKIPNACIERRNPITYRCRNEILVLSCGYTAALAGSDSAYMQLLTILHPLFNLQRPPPPRGLKN